jgi:hypothetical protein
MITRLLVGRLTPAIRANFLLLAPQGARKPPYLNAKVVVRNAEKTSARTRAAGFTSDRMILL